MIRHRVFVRPILRGKRFKTHSVPVDVLPGLSTYREVLVEVAAHLFFAANPNRLRLPRHFARRLELSLREVEEGSAVPVLIRETKAGYLFAPPHDLFDSAVSTLNDSIAHVQKHGTLPDGFPKRGARLLSQLGSYLEPGESLEFD